jgi:hypothetical protein
MMKTIPWRMMARGCSVGVLAGLLVVAFESSDFQGEICEYNQATKHEDCTTYSLFPFLLIKVFDTLNYYGVAITALATVFIGVFTLTLKLSTDNLWTAAKDQIAAAENAAKMQSRDMQASISVADKAANAAKQSADVAEQALYGTEAPFIFIIIESTDGNAIVTVTSPQGVKYPEHVSYMLHNYGRSPAIIREIYIACIASDAMLDPCPFPPLQSNLFQSEIVGSGESSQSKPLPQIASFLPNDGKSHPGAVVIVCGQVRYADVFGNQYLSGFSYAFNSYFNRFHAVGGANHNYRRKLNEDENREAEKRDIFPF